MIELKNGKYYEFGLRVFWLFLFRRSFFTVVFLAIALLLGFVRPFLVNANIGLFGHVDLNAVSSIAMSGLFILAVLAEGVGFIMARLEYSLSKVMIDSYSVKITRGVLSKEELDIPYRNIQSVEIEQSFINRFLGIGRLVIATTTNLGQNDNAPHNQDDDKIIPFMNHALAEAVADAITERAQVERMQMQREDISQK